MLNIELLKNVNLNVPYIIKEYKSETIILDEDEEINYVGIILKGTVTISSSTLDGFEFEILRLNRNDIFGDSLIFKDSPKLPGFIKASKESIILYINKKDFLNLLSSNKEFLFNYLKYESERNIHQQYKIKLLGQPSIREKILFYLKEEIKKTNSNKVYLNMTKENLALMMGLNRPSLSRELIRMKKDKLISYDNRSITYLK